MNSSSFTLYSSTPLYHRDLFLGQSIQAIDHLIYQPIGARELGFDRAQEIEALFVFRAQAGEQPGRVIKPKA